MKYSVVIGTYNHCDDLLKRCVEALIKYTNLEDIELIIVANGCTDETKEYLLYLESYFKRTNIAGFQQVFFAKPLGYSKANNIGIRMANADKIVLLSNDAFLLEQNKNDWLNILDDEFEKDPKCGVAAVLKSHCEAINRQFAIFFLVMIKREVFDKIGLINEDYGVGGCEDIEFCVEAENAGYTVNQAGPQVWTPEISLYVGTYPVLHEGEGTVHDKTLVPDYEGIFHQNTIRLAKKYNPGIVKRLDYREHFSWLKEKYPTMYHEIFIQDDYRLVQNERIENRNVLDIGGNIGAFSLLASYLGAKKVVCVEPISTTYQSLLENIEQAKITNITPLKNVVSEVSGDLVKISLNNHSGLNSMFNVENDFETIESITLTEALAHFDNNDILLKIDCEGAEYDILLNATEEDMSRISEIVMELHTDFNPKYKGSEIMDNKLSKFGFTKLREDQMYIWYKDENGNVVNQTELPCLIVRWGKQ